MENYTEKMMSLQMQVYETKRKAQNEIEDLKRQHRNKVSVMANELAMNIQRIERQRESKEAELMIKMESLKNEKREEGRKRYAEVRAEIQQLITQIGAVGCLTQQQKDCLKDSM